LESAPKYLVTKCNFKQKRKKNYASKTIRLIRKRGGGGSDFIGRYLYIYVYIYYMYVNKYTHAHNNTLDNTYDIYIYIYIYIKYMYI